MSPIANVTLQPQANVYFDGKCISHSFTLPDGTVPQDHLFEGGPDLAWEADIAWIIRGGADPMAWIAADAVLAVPFVRNILRKNYSYLTDTRA